MCNFFFKFSPLRDEEKPFVYYNYIMIYFSTFFFFTKCFSAVRENDSVFKKYIVERVRGKINYYNKKILNYENFG